MLISFLHNEEFTKRIYVCGNVQSDSTQSMFVPTLLQPSTLQAFTEGEDRYSVSEELQGYVHDNETWLVSSTETDDSGLH